MNTQEILLSRIPQKRAIRFKNGEVVWIRSWAGQPICKGKIVGVLYGGAESYDVETEHKDRMIITAERLVSCSV